MYAYKYFNVMRDQLTPILLNEPNYDTAKETTQNDHLAAPNSYHEIYGYNEELDKHIGVYQLKPGDCLRGVPENEEPWTYRCESCPYRNKCPEPRE